MKPTERLDSQPHTTETSIHDMPRRSSCWRFAAVVVMVALAISVPTSSARGQCLVIGTFDSTRAGGANLVDGALSSQIRASITSAFPNASIVGTDALTPGFLSSVNVLILEVAKAATTAIAPLTPAEQSALAGFVAAGGHYIVFLDNDTFAGGGSDAVNESLVDAFGFDVIGTGAPWQQVATVAVPLASPITSGRFGTVSTYQVGWSGWLNGVPATAAVLATLNQNVQPHLATIAHGALGAQAGSVTVLGDTTMLFDGFFTASNAILVRNAIDYAIGGNLHQLADIDNNGIVNIDDLLAVINSWGRCPPPAPPACSCPADIAPSPAGNGLVNIDDLLMVINNWG